ncbi:MAG: carbohydrate-binding protein [Planctomycetes bacterium]|nr:carbohydrate-binding protein [Planctomycetota bacterium]
MGPKRRIAKRSHRDPLLNKWLVVVLILGAGLIGCVLHFQKNKNEKRTGSAEQPKTVEKQRAGTGRDKTEKERSISEHGITFTYELKEPGLVSAGVYNRHGVLVRTLLRARPQDPGQHILRWDGLNRLGKPQPPGEYTIKVLRKPPFKKEFIMQVGVNPKSKPYHRWVGDFGGGTSVAVDNSGMYVASRNAEGNYMLIKQSLDGTERMWQREDVDPWRGGLSLGTDGKTVYVLQQNAFITLFDAATGRHTGRWDALPKNHKHHKLKGRKRRKIKYTDHHPIAAMDFAVRGQHRVLTDQKANVMKWLAEDGSVTRRAKVDSPRGVAIAPDGTVYIISGDKIVSGTPQGETGIIVQGLNNPRRLTYDTANDELLVVEGPDDRRVKRFDLTGALQQTYGREGGRQDGPYKPGDFRGVKDITADGKGGFFVAESETPPRRVAHMNAEGELIREWYGGLTFFSPHSVDPRDPTQVWYRVNGGGGWVLAEVDYENRTWSVQETHRFRNKAGGLGRGLGNRRRFVVRYHGDKRYLVGESFPPMVFRHRDGKLLPLVIGNRGRKFPQARTVARLMTQSDNPETIKGWIRENLGKKRRKKNTYFWTDKNGDHQPQPEEITLHKLGNVYHGPGSGAYITDDFSVICRGGDYNPRRDEANATKFYTSIARLSPANWTEGVPQYDLPEQASELDVAPLYVEPRTDAYIGRAGGHNFSSFQDRKGALYAFYHWGGRGFGGFPNYQAGRYVRLTRWNSDGKRLWSVGRKASGANKAAIYWNPTAPGCIHYPSLIAGEIRDTVVVCDRIVNPGMVWTTDGLFAGSFFPGRVEDGLPGWVYVWQRDMETNTHSLVNHDSLEGGAITEYKDKVYYYSPGCNSVVLYRIHGYDRDEWRRIQETVRVDGIMPHAREEGTGLRAEIYGGTEMSGPPASTIESVSPGSLTVSESVDTSEGVAVRMTGMLEAPLSEEFQLSIGGGAVRAWINGRQVIERWNEDQRYGAGGTTEPIPLQAGERIPIQIDFYTTNPGRLQESKKRSIPLRWESKNTDPNYIPARFLYPGQLKTISRVGSRPATEQIHARSHDHTISSDAEGLYFDNFHCRHHMSGLSNGKHLGYRKIDFGDGVDKFVINLRKGNATPVKIDIRLDAPDGPLMETVTLPKITFDYRKDKNLTFDLNAPQLQGVHDLYLVAAGGRHGPRMRWFAFE